MSCGFAQGDNQGNDKRGRDSMHLNEAERCVEAILFAGGEPVESDKISRALDIEAKVVSLLVERIRERYLGQQSPFDIVTLDGAYQMCTLAQYAPHIRSVLEIRRETPLSQASLEVLAVIAYNQPITRAYIEQVRGVDCSSIIRALAEKELIEEAGRLPLPGRPLSYRTTPNFLRCFGLESLDGLPNLPNLPPPKHKGDISITFEDTI